MRSKSKFLFLAAYSCILHVIVVLWFSKVYGYNPYTLENHSTADLYYDATTQTLGSVSLPQSLYFTMQLGCIFIHPRVYEISRVHGFCTSCFSFEVWLHHSTSSSVRHVLYIYRRSGNFCVMKLSYDKFSC